MASMHPTEDSVEVVFDAVQTALDNQMDVVATWTNTDIQRFCALAGAYLDNTVASRKRAREEVESAAQPDGDGRESSGDSIASARLQSADRLFQSLQRVRTHLKKIVPFGSIKEGVFVPQSNPEFDPAVPAVDVDAFLYDEHDVEELVEASLVSRSYCKDCASTRIGDVQFISHSFSRDQLVYLFCYALPWVVRDFGCDRRAGMTICDVGSRLGIVLASAAMLGQSNRRSNNAAKENPNGLQFQRITGIEINQQFCSVQQQLMQKLGLAGNASVKCIDALSAEGLAEIRGHDVVILHNVFEWFAAEDDQLAVWKQLRETLNRPGQILVVVPTLDQSMAHLVKCAKGSSEVLNVVGSPDFISSWVSRCDLDVAVATFEAERLGDHADHGCDEGDCAAHQEILELVSLINVYMVKG